MKPAQGNELLRVARKIVSEFKEAERIRGKRFPVMARGRINGKVWSHENGTFVRVRLLRALESEVRRQKDRHAA